MVSSKSEGPEGPRRDLGGTVPSMQALTGGQPCGVIHRLSTGEHGVLNVEKVGGTGGPTFQGVPSTLVPPTLENEEKLSTGSDWGDDRVFCKDCGHKCRVEETINIEANKWEVFRAANHPAGRWMFEPGVAVVRNGWVRIKYERSSCDVEGMECFPDDVKHRCSQFIKIDEYVKEPDWWESQKSESNTASKSEWWQG